MTSLTSDFRHLEVEMKLRFWNRNYVGTQFGGSLYSMTDPFYMLMLMDNLGSEYVVWDKSARIHYKKPGRGPVRATFKLTQERLDTIKSELLTHGKIEPVFHIQVLDSSQELIAEVERTIHIHLRKQIPAKP